MDDTGYKDGRKRERERRDGKGKWLKQPCEFMCERPPLRRTFTVSVEVRQPSGTDRRELSGIEFVNCPRDGELIVYILPSFVQQSRIKIQLMKTLQLCPHASRNNWRLLDTRHCYLTRCLLILLFYLNALPLAIKYAI